MTPFNKTLDEYGREIVLAFCDREGVLIADLRSRDQRAIGVDVKRRDLARLLSQEHYTNEQIGKALNRGDAWVRSVLASSERPQGQYSHTFPKGVTGVDVRTLPDGRIRVVGVDR